MDALQEHFFQTLAVDTKNCLADSCCPQLQGIVAWHGALFRLVDEQWIQSIQEESRELNVFISSAFLSGKKWYGHGRTGRTLNVCLYHPPFFSGKKWYGHVSTGRTTVQMYLNLK